MLHHRLNTIGRAWLRVGVPAGLALCLCSIPTARTATEDEGLSALMRATAEAPKTLEECQARNGVWGSWGGRMAARAGRKSCRFPAADAGKACRTGSDCSLRVCEATRDAPVAEDGTVQGVCPKFWTGFGCHSRVVDGRPTPWLCVD